MKAVLNSLLLLIASATDRALVRHVQYLKAENEILRSKLPKVVSVTPRSATAWSAWAGGSARPSIS